MFQIVRVVSFHAPLECFGSDSGVASIRRLLNGGGGFFSLFMLDVHLGIVGANSLGFSLEVVFEIKVLCAFQILLVISFGVIDSLLVNFDLVKVTEILNWL